MRLVKLMMLWLLVAALPLQGWAAVLKASCDTRHHAPSLHASALAPGAIQQPQASAHGHGDSHDHHAHHGVTQDQQHASLEASGEPPASAAQAADSLPDHSACSACSSCCAGATAPPPAALAAPDVPPTAALFAAPSTLLVNFIPPGLERPPRPRHA
ncbi:hypothetical protein [Lacisediminimonas profundi]|uniref:hypothetical protein n=1 Tax=Lacisediminimonas profundi TaxID=2603856 RepID=UPI00124B7EA4|nr:hypothetical protein [Lacisediminimonas profundi]